MPLLNNGQNENNINIVSATYELNKKTDSCVFRHSVHRAGGGRWGSSSAVAIRKNQKQKDRAKKKTNWDDRQKESHQEVSIVMQPKQPIT